MPGNEDVAVPRESEVFPQHASFIHELASELEPEEQEMLQELLTKLGKGLAHASAREPEPAPGY